MPRIDQFIDFMLKQQAERFIVPSGRNCILQRASGATPVQQTLSSAQIQSVIQEIAPAGAGASFIYDSPAGRFEVAIEGSDGNLQMTITPAREAAVPAPPPVVASAPPPVPDSVVGETSVGDGKVVEHMDQLFRLVKEVEGSDIHISSSRRPCLRIHGTITELKDYKINTHGELKKLLWEIIPERNRGEWEKTHDTDFAYELPGVARYRCNIFCDRHGIGGVFRLIPQEVWTVEQMGLPKAMVDLCWLSKGLVVVTGPTGSGKTTTLGALMDYVNKNREDHVITIEDPVEFVHDNIKCLINQRQVHEHTDSFSKALRAALREDPDVIMVGEMRDLETTELAIHCAETGHLVFATLHTSSAPSTVDRIIDQFPPEQQAQIRVMLSGSLKAVIAQILVKTKDGRRRAAFEILLVDNACANLIREGKTFQLISIMQVGKGRGCKTMEDSLMELIDEDVIEPKEAYFRSLDKVGMKQRFEAKNIQVNLADVGE